MIYFLLYLLNSLGVATFVLATFDNPYALNVITTISYNALHLYSYLQIEFNKFCKTWNKSAINDTISDEYYFTFKINTNNGVDKQITYATEIECSNIKFLLVELVVDDVCHKIDLKTDQCNYYVVGNEFRKQFFEYYASKHLNNVVMDMHKKCVVRILDENMETHEIELIHRMDAIRIEKNSWKLVLN